MFIQPKCCRILSISHVGVVLLFVGQFHLRDGVAFAQKLPFILTPNLSDTSGMQKKPIEKKRMGCGIIIQPQRSSVGMLQFSLGSCFI